MAEQVAGVVATIKDIFGLLREVIIVVAIAALLLAPAKINRILMDAGFTSASIAGLEWKNQLLESAETNKEAQEQITKLEKQLTDVQASLQSISQRAPDAEVRAQAAKLSGNIQNVRNEADHTRDALANRVRKQAEFLGRVDPKMVETNPRIFKGTSPP
jgi:peptidoglycan hydrolase CwlO-like protein